MRLPLSRRKPREAPRPQLELELPRVRCPEAQEEEQEDNDERREETPRGVAIVDFYI